MTSSDYTVTQRIIMAFFTTVIFFNPFIPSVVGFPVGFVAMIIFGLPIFIISEGMKRGLGKTFYKTSNGHWRLLIDAGVRVGCLLILTLLAVFYPGVALVLVLAFPYNLLLLFGLAVWIGETIAVGRFIYRGRTIVATTEMLLRN
jgi:hypothetical protein